MNRALSFGNQNFGQVNLKDQRRTRRLVDLVDVMLRHPGGSLPDKLNRPADLRAFYRLMNRKEVTHDVLITSHADQTRRTIAVQDDTVLILHDATELDYSTLTTLRDHLGQIGCGTTVGYICHNSLAVRADTGETLGLTSQILHHRATVPKKETAKQKRERLSRESRLWVKGAKNTGLVQQGPLVVDVSDSLSDTFEYMSYEVNHQRHFVLRAKENRKLVKPLFGQAYLFDAMREAPSVHERQVRIAGTTNHKPRTATVQVSFCKVGIALPAVRSGEYSKEPLELWAVRVWEPNPPEGVEALEWVLLTNVEVTNAAEAEERIAWYERRPIIEEYHKGQKTGCQIPAMQFTTLGGLEPAIAVLSAVATTLLRLRDAARAPDADKRMATEVVAPEYVEVLTSHYCARLSPTPTVKEFYMHVARLGGHQNRKCDGFPGWITLWRGWMKLQAMLDGRQATLRRQTKRCGKT